MSISIEKINHDVNELKGEISELKANLNEEFELSKSAKKELTQARKDKDYVSHDEVMKKFG